ncbi:MAG: (Fe-S)-binding protein [Promethearchaeota archaeon]
MQGEGKIEPVTKEFFDAFKFDECERCGECLTHCPVMPFTTEEAKGEIAALIEGKPTKRLLSDCQSCFTCNFYCKHGCNPTSLVLQRWNEQYKREGLKVRGRYYMTLHPNYPNFRTYAMERMTPEERELVASWRSDEPLRGDTLTYPGCNVILTPTLVKSGLFDGLDIRGRLEYCCGETLFRTGYVDELRQVAARLDKWFNSLKPKHLLVLCTAGTNVFKNVLPHYGLTYQFESIKSYVQWLWEKFRAGEVEVTRPLDMTVTVQDSCYGKMFGDDYMDLPRKILREIGCDVVEMDLSRENMRCCGIAAGFSVDSAYHPFKIRGAAVDNLKMAKRTGADALCVYCSGCNQTFHTAKKLYAGRTQPIYHLIELVQLAIGETPRRLVKRTASKMFWGVMKKQLPKVRSKETFHLPPIPEDPEDSAW